MEKIILVFLKFPENGKVKTRLAASIGNEKAVKIYNTLVTKVIKNLPKSDFKIIFTFSPKNKEKECKEWIIPKISESNKCKIEFQHQSDGDLGDRLSNAFKSAFSKNRIKFCAVIGTDCIDISSEIFLQTNNYLKSVSDLVIGPTFDGGYYYLATKNYHKELFSDISWSTEKTYKDTISQAKKLNLKIKTLPKKNDVDDINDWNLIKNNMI